MLRDRLHFDLLLESESFAAENEDDLLSALDVDSKAGNVLKKPAAASGASQRPVLKRPAAASTKPGKKRKTEDEKIQAAVEKRLLKDAPLGRCPHWDCQDALEVVPNKIRGALAWVGCPRWRTGRCTGHIRMITPDEVSKTPKKLIRMKKLK